MALELSDVELRSRLKGLGVNVGPVTDSTREFYKKKLQQLTSGSAKNRRKSTPSRAVHPDDVGSSLLEYSSEDSEVDSSRWNLAPGTRRTRRRTLPPEQLNVSIAKSLLEGPSTSNDPSVFKVPTPVSVGRSNRSRSSNIFQEVSDCSDILTRPKLKSGRRSQQFTSSYEIESSDTDIEVERRPRRASSQLPSPVVVANLGEETFSSEDRRFRSLSKNKYTLPKLIENNIQDHHVGKQNGGQVNDSSFNGEFQVADVRHSSANYSHLISMLLLGLITVFFVVVGVLYVGVKQDNHISSSSLEHFTDVVCRGMGNEDCIEKEDVLSALKVARSLHSIVSLAAGNHECTHDKWPVRWVSTENMKLQLVSLHPELRGEKQMDKALKNCVLLLKHHPEWGVRILLEAGSQTIRAFEATVAYKSLWCRLKLSVKAVFYKIVLIFSAIVSVLAMFAFVKIYKKRKKLHQQQVYEMVEDIIDILRDHYEKNGSNNNIDASVPIIHVRDMLIPPAERKDKQKLWDEAVCFLKENESRVITERKRLAGEEFLAWRWLQQATPLGSKKNKVWQGQAFGNSGKGMNYLPFSPTPCLKIRNMFDSTMEFGDNWHVTIQDAILEKCQGNSGIVHMVVDTKSRDGCVYIKFNSPEAAGKAYRALHGWWFDGKLLTVKYLRLERYLSRFPDSANHTTPLKPSNNMQLSLQGDSSMSILESS